jgi:hypothetical protein
MSGLEGKTETDVCDMFVCQSGLMSRVQDDMLGHFHQDGYRAYHFCTKMKTQNIHNGLHCRRNPGGTSIVLASMESPASAASWPFLAYILTRNCLLLGPESFHFLTVLSLQDAAYYRRLATILLTDTAVLCLVVNRRSKRAPFT